MKQLSHILVPLDGSELSEKALETAFTLAEYSKAEVTIMKVLRPVEEILTIDKSNASFIKEQEQAREKKNTEYLDEVKGRYKDTSIVVNPVLKTGSDAETIIEYAKEKGVDLIVMATHGRTGLHRWVYGSVSTKVLNGASHPVLLVRSFED